MADYSIRFCRHTVKFVGQRVRERESRKETFRFASRCSRFMVRIWMSFWFNWKWNSFPAVISRRNAIHRIPLFSSLSSNWWFRHTAGSKGSKGSNRSRIEFSNVGCPFVAVQYRSVAIQFTKLTGTPENGCPVSAHANWWRQCVWWRRCVCPYIGETASRRFDRLLDRCLDQHFYRRFEEAPLCDICTSNVPIEVGAPRGGGLDTLSSIGRYSHQ